MLETDRLGKNEESRMRMGKPIRHLGTKRLVWLTKGRGFNGRV